MAKTATDLYRLGSASSPRITHVRVGKDILTFQMNGVDWVAGCSGGVSTFASQGNGKNWWVLDSGYDIPSGLMVVNDHGDHFSWEPSVDMTLADFIALMAAVEPAFRKIS